MKTLYTFIICFSLILFKVNTLKGQDYIMTNGGNITACSGNFLDPGGWGNYPGTVSTWTYTICNPIAGQPLYLEFTSFHLWGNNCVIPSYDELYIYNGNSTSAPQIGRYTRQNGPTAIIMASSGCITFRFVRDSGTFLCASNSGAPGWRAIISCNPPNVNDGQSCITANPFCSNNNYNFPNTTNNQAIAGANYGCLLSQPNPIWYYMEIDQPGTLQLNVQQTTGMGGTGAILDVDFAMWGPYNNLVAACTDIMSGRNPIQCSYHPSYTETIGIGLQGGSNFTAGGQTTPPSAQSGEIYVVMITNYSSQAGYISFNQTGGTGTTSCNIIDLSCAITNLTHNTSCVSPTEYILSGVVEFSNPPSTGTLTVTTSCGGNQVFNAPFTSPITYSINGLNPNGNNCTVSAVFSDSSTCLRSDSYQAPSVVTPSFDPIMACEGTTPPVLPSTSLEGISGTWTPSVINTSLAGSYTHIFTPNTAGCHQTTTLNITVHSLPNVQISPSNYALSCATPQTVQLNGSSSTPGVNYTWTGNGFVSGQNTPTPIVNASGTYTLTVTNNITGCSNSANAIVNPDPTMPIVNIDAPLPISCDNPTITLNASSPTSGITFNWTNNPGIVSGANTMTPTINQAGTYQIVVQDASGCTNAASVTVNGSIALPNVNNTPTNYQISCTNPNVVIDGTSTNSNVSYAWTHNNTPIGINNSEITATAPGTYIVTVVDTTNNCSNSATFNVLGTNTPPTLTVNPHLPLSCYNPTIQLQAVSNPSNIVHSWAGPGIVSGGDTPTATVDQIGVYTIGVMDTTSNCFSFTTVTVTEIDDILPTIFSDTTLCSNTFQIPLDSISYNGSLTWTELNGKGSFDDNTLVNATFIGENGTTNYTLIFVDACGYTDTANITIYTPNIITAPTISCNLAELNISTNSSSGGIWSVLDNPSTPFLEDTCLIFMYGDTLPSGNRPTAVRVTLHGDYTLYFTSNNLCPDTSIILHFPPYIFTKIDDDTICMNKTHEIIAKDVQHPVNYLWNTGETTPSIIVDQAGEYIVTISNDCYSYSDTANISFKTCEIDAPNVISLSSQTGNDKWYIKDVDLVEFNCIIANRWGNIIVELNKNNPQWDGKDSSGNLVTEGVYFYVLNAKTKEGKEISKHGFIQVVH